MSDDDYMSDGDDILDDDDTSDEDLTEAINTAMTKYELMQVANGLYQCGKVLSFMEESAFRNKVVSFDREMTKEDWETIQMVAGLDSVLEKTAANRLK